MAYPIKNKERHDFYYSVENPAISYKDFVQRCRNNEHKLDKQLMEQLIMTHKTTYSCKVDQYGRDCSYCKVYNTRSCFYKSENQSYWHNSRCNDCVRKKTEILVNKVVYATKSKYVSPLKVRSRKWKMMSVKDIAAMEWIHKKYCPHIRQMLYNWRDLEKMVERYKNYIQLEK